MNGALRINASAGEPQSILGEQPITCAEQLGEPGIRLNAASREWPAAT